jgi:phosphoribosyl-ATP pyrophosphohydrolase
MDKRIINIAEYFGKKDRPRKLTEECFEACEAWIKGDIENFRKEFSDMMLVGMTMMHHEGITVEDMELDFAECLDKVETRIKENYYER